MNEKKPLLEVNHLSKRFAIESSLFASHGSLDAVRNVSFSIHPGEIVGMAGESGSGKTTIGKMIQGILEPSSGQILIGGKEAKTRTRRERAKMVQMVFQDPFASLNPKLSIGTILSEAVREDARARSLTLTGEDILRAATELLTAVGMPANILQDYPHQFSGGQRQRIVIARSLAMNPRILIADEPVSSLDLSIQAQILNLLMDLNEKFNLAILLITHDLSIIRHCSDRTIVIREGEIVEESATQTLFDNPKDPYTRELLLAGELS